MCVRVCVCMDDVGEGRRVMVVSHLVPNETIRSPWDGNKMPSRDQWEGSPRLKFHGGGEGSNGSVGRGQPSSQVGEPSITVVSRDKTFKRNN